MHTQANAVELADAARGAPGAPPNWWAPLGEWQGWRQPLEFVVAFAFLNAVMNERYPAQQPALWYLLPSLDVVAVFVVFALCGAWRTRVPRAVHAALVGLFLLSRVLRIADGVEMGAYYRNFNTVVDFSLLPEFVRLFYTTVPLLRFALACAAVACALCVIGFLVHRALRTAEIALASPTCVQGFAALVGVLALASSFERPAPREQHSAFEAAKDQRLSGAFGSSIFARVATELTFAANIGGYRADELGRVASVQRKLLALAPNLAKLGGQNVYLFVIESYGQSVVDRPSIAAQVLPEYRRFEADLAEKGFHIASRVLDSSTYGGRSWLAHATLAVGVRTVDQFQLELLRAAQPKSLALAFGQAGYRTVLVQPATRRDLPVRDFQHFQSHYYTRDFAYSGPEYGWSPMPDEFVVDFVRRHELMSPTRPLFLEYALTSSHAPWSDLPPLVGDWSRLQAGTVYNQLPSTHFRTGWLALDGASDAYARSVVYDLEVLRRYIGDFIRDGSLVILLGDHQPHSEVTQHSPFGGVPVHVLSRNPAFVDPFRARGYTPGMLTRTAGPHPGLETFMPDLLADFSLDRAKGAD
jgi:hypothetical protein